MGHYPGLGERRVSKKEWERHFRQIRLEQEAARRKAAERKEKKWRRIKADFARARGHDA